MDLEIEVCPMPMPTPDAAIYLDDTTLTPPAARTIFSPASEGLLMNPIGMLVLIIY